MTTDVRGKAKLGHAAPQEITFSYFGALAAGAQSAPWVSAVDATVVGLRGLLQHSGSSQTVVTVYRDGTAVTTLTIPAGQVSVSKAVDIDMVGDQDFLTMAITTAGTGALSLAVIARLL